MKRGTVAAALLLAAFACSKNESTGTTPAAALPTASASVASPQPSSSSACKTAADCFGKEALPKDATWVCQNGECIRRSTGVP